WDDYRLKFDHLQASSDFLRRNQLALAGAGAHTARLLPVLGGGDVARPERPGAALRRTHGVDGAAFFPLVEDAVAVGLLPQRQAAPGPTGVQGLELLDALAPVRRQGGDVVLPDPDEAGLAGAAVAAAGAGEAQAVLVPGFLAHACPPPSPSGVAPTHDRRW